MLIPDPNLKYIFTCDIVFISPEMLNWHPEGGVTQNDFKNGNRFNEIKV